MHGSLCDCNTSSPDLIMRFQWYTQRALIVHVASKRVARVPVGGSKNARLKEKSFDLDPDGRRPVGVGGGGGDELLTVFWNYILPNSSTGLPVQHVI